MLWAPEELSHRRAPGAPLPPPLPLPADSKSDATLPPPPLSLLRRPRWRNPPCALAPGEAPRLLPPLQLEPPGR